MDNIIKALRITIAFCLVLAVLYVGVLFGFGKLLGPGKGNAQTLALNGEVVGAVQVGQAFTKDIYFWGRPSAVDYLGDASGASNKGPAEADYLEEVEARIDTFLVHHPYLERKDVPAEMVTASGSGLDPHITPSCAYIQAKRVAQARHMTEEGVMSIIEENIESPFLGMFGPSKINVLKLNVALDRVNSTQE